MKQLLLRGEPLGKIKGIIFDKDGTLVNSEEYLLKLAQIRIDEALNIYKKEKKNENQILELEILLNNAYGISNECLNPNLLMAIDSRENNLISTATIFCLVGENWPRALDIANKVFISSDRIYKEKATNYRNALILPGAKQLLNKLNKNGLKIGLMSNDSIKGIDYFLAYNNIQNIFQIFWGSENYPKKPNPEALIAYCKLLKIDPSECALASDSDTDLRMGKKSNVRTCLGYSAGWSSPPLLYEHHHLIKHWNELDIQ